mgnify:FL=1
MCQALAVKQQSGRATRTYKPDNALLRFLLQHRMPQRYGIQNLAPGHPVYESIRKEVLEEQRRKDAVSEQEVFDSLEKKLSLIRERYGIAEGS